jgi:oxygen-independent coproporphyrinogen-3 oxidase
VNSALAKRLALDLGLRRGIQWLYPPASVWEPLGLAEVKDAWSRTFADAAKAASAVDLHVNVPFTEFEPRYCDYIHAREPSADERGRYVDLLAAELATLELPRGARFRRLFLTGGAAGALSPSQSRRLFDVVLRDARFDFPDAVMELDHCPAPLGTLKALAEGGVRRAIVGVQSLEPPLSRRLGWERSPRDVGRLVESLRRAGVPRLRFNVTAGLPGQTERGFLAGLGFLLSLAPEAVLLQPFTPAPLAPLHPKARARAPQALSPAALVARSRMIDSGYRLIRRARLPESPSEDWCGAYGSALCLGFGSLSRARGRLLYRRGLSLGEYRRAVAAGRGRGFYGCAMDRRREMRSYLIWKLECPGAVSAAEFRRLFGAELAAEFPVELAELSPRGGGGLDLSRLPPLQRAVLSKRFYEEDVAARVAAAVPEGAEVDRALLQLYRF